MSNELIERLAREAGIAGPGDIFLPAGLRALNRFAALVAEQCAIKCDQRRDAYRYETDPWAAEHVSEAGYCGDAIRAAFPMPKD